MRILITGANGQLGKSINSRLKNHLPAAEAYNTDIEELDILSAGDVQNMIQDLKIECIINCAAYTAVDMAEDEEDKAFQINAEGPAILAKASRDAGAQFIHISTDYVFDGKAYRPYRETDQANPQGVYGKSKLAGEKNILATNNSALIIRTSWLYSEHGSNFVKTMLRLGSEREQLGVVADQIGNPTYAGDLAEAILSILQKKKQGMVSGIFHYSNEGIASWYDLAVAIMEYSNISCDINAIRTEDFPLPAPRPFYSALEKTLIKETFQLDIPHWRYSLKCCLDQM